MGLLDRLLGGSKSVTGTTPAKPAPKQESFFLDADASSSMGNVEFMRRSNTIRRTFPGTADSPGNKEMVAEVASMESRLEKATPGLGGATSQEAEINLTGGVFVNQSAAFSDFHATGANPAANASYSDSAFVANRFRVIQRRAHTAPAAAPTA